MESQHSSVDLATAQLNALTHGQSAEIFKLFVDTVKDYALFVMSMDGTILTWNEGARHIKGYEANEIIGQHFSRFYTEEAKKTNHPEHELEIAAREGRYEEEGWRVRKDGSKFWANVTITLLKDPDGNKIGFAKVTRDLTERRKADDEREQATRAAETFKLMVETVKDYAIFMLDPKGYIVTWNEGARRIKGYTADEIIGSHFSRFYTEPDINRRHPENELEIAIREGRYEEEGWRVRKDGSTFWANVVITAVRDRSGLLLGFAKVTRDLTERRKAQQDLEIAAHNLKLLNDQLAKANVAKDVFLANMSHELRTPLNSIMGFNDVMLLGLAGPLNETQTKQAVFIKRAAQHLLSLINDILDLAKIESGKMELDVVDLNLSPLLSDVVAGVQPLAGERKLYLHFEEPSSVPLIHADERAVRQIVTNLISNAIKFTDDGGVTVSIKTPDSDCVDVSVKDTGIGISKADQSQLFQGFVQLSRQERKQEGTGLGLALSKRLAELMNGQIIVESEPGTGSTFVLRLPAVRS